MERHPAALPLSPSACRLYVIRHGETEWNVKGKLQGQEDTDLNERGTRQAHVAAAHLRSHCGGLVAATYSSDLKRTRATAEPIADALATPLRFDTRLRETHFGEWQGCSWEEVERTRQEEVARWRADPDFAVPGGESRRARFQRVNAVLHDIALQHLGECVVIVTHSGILDDVGRLVRRVPWGAHTGLRKVNAGISVCEFRVPDPPRSVTTAFPKDASPELCGSLLGDWQLLEWGITAHLELEHRVGVVHAAADCTRPETGTAHSGSAVHDCTVGGIGPSAQVPEPHSISTAVPGPMNNGPAESTTEATELDAAADDAEQGVAGV
jgi:2,3-bisphosphoglycerate-dependent phosphoglycerate mutase